MQEPLSRPSTIRKILWWWHEPTTGHQADQGLYKQPDFLPDPLSGARMSSKYCCQPLVYTLRRAQADAGNIWISWHRRTARKLSFQSNCRARLSFLLLRWQRELPRQSTLARMFLTRRSPQEPQFILAQLSSWDGLYERVIKPVPAIPKAPMPHARKRPLLLRSTRVLFVRSTLASKLLTRRSPQESQFILVPLRSWAGHTEAAVTASRNSQGSTADIPGREIENKGIRRLEMPFRATPTSRQEQPLFSIPVWFKNSKNTFPLSYCSSFWRQS